MDKLLKIYDHQRNDQPWTIKILEEGDKYGLDNCLTHEGELVVEFYDGDYAFDIEDDGTVLGQFVSRYFVETILEGNNTGGLNLMGYEPKWTIEVNAMSRVRDFLREVTA